MSKILALVSSLSILAALPALAGWDEGVAAFTSKDYQRAAAEFQELVKQNPDGWRGHYLLGLSLEQLERKEEALHHLRKAYDLNPNDLSVKVALGRAYHDVGRYGDAATLLDGVDPNSLPGGQRAAFYQIRANSKLKVGDQTGAVADFAGLAGLQPNDGRVQYLYGTVAVAAGQLDAGLDALAKASRLAPEDSDVKRAYAQALLEKGRLHRDRAARRDAYGKAASLAAEIVAADPSYDNYILKVSAELGAGLYADAVESAKAAVARNDADWLGHFYLGQAYTSGAQFAAAEEPLAAARDRAERPGDVKAVWRQLGYAYEKQKKYTQAIEAYRLAGDSAGAARVAESERTSRFNREVEEENKQIEAMRKEAEKLEAELKALEGGGGR